MVAIVQLGACMDSIQMNSSDLLSCYRRLFGYSVVRDSARSLAAEAVRLIEKRPLP